VIYYLHGFTSAPASWKARALHERMAGRGLQDAFWCEQLPVSPKAAISMIEAAVAARRDAAPTFVGSSLGGFYATCLAEKLDAKAVLINPAVLAPLVLEKWLGEHENLYTGEHFVLTPTHIEELRRLDLPAVTRPERYWLLVETGDETLDWRVAVARYVGARQTVCEGGDHSFTRFPDYLDEIVAFAALA
jgi:predicted esterase YcpF (UPF0227 family)